MTPSTGVVIILDEGTDVSSQHGAVWDEISSAGDGPALIARDVARLRSAGCIGEPCKNVAIIRWPSLLRAA